MLDRLLRLANQVLVGGRGVVAANHLVAPVIQQGAGDLEAVWVFSDLGRRRQTPEHVNVERDPKPALDLALNLCAQGRGSLVGALVAGKEPTIGTRVEFEGAL